MEDWLASYKDNCEFNLGESGVPDLDLENFLDKCGLSLDSIKNIILKDNDTRGTERLRNAILSTYGPAVSFENVTVTTGTGEALFILFNLLLNDRKVCIAPFPSFQAIYEIPEAIGAEMRYYHLSENNGFIPDPDEILPMIDENVGVLVINNPHNPSGVLIPKEIFEIIAEKAMKYSVKIIADEHYRFLPHNGSYPSESFADPERNIIATGSITKCFGCIGLRMGWIIAPEPLIKSICDFRDYLTHTLSPISDFLAFAAIEKMNNFLPGSIEKINRNKEDLIGMINKNGFIEMTYPNAGVVCFPRYYNNIKSDILAKELLDTSGVFILPGSAFETEGHFRINLAMENEMFLKALSNIEKYFTGKEI